uniref:G-type lectin S-receptor-like serine/threonine-protein kinase RLK1 n=1 Tax=Populus alba TaxID=43335 RepID=A0A4U5PL98_POPAL|nr:G-type lectin S-receptor-like serine/threonine-protein kinase RLK1 [Populus alba]
MAFAYAAFFLLVICIYKPASSQQNHSNLISLGSSISTNVQPTSWRSPSGTFAFGFYPQGSGFIVGIWLVCKPADIITWTAYRDDPPVPSNATLEFTVNGKLLLRTYSANNEAGEEKLIAKIEKSASNARMFDSGNLVLYNEHSDAIWESFNFPTDTILGGQNLYAGGELLSSASTTDFSTGRFRLKMQSDGNLVLYPVATLDIAADAYWSTDTFGSSGTHLYLNYTGELLILNKTSGIVRDVFNSYSKSESSSIIYRATLENNGIFKLYSHNFDSNGAYTTSLNDSAPESQCKVKTFCGLNSYCTMNDDQPDCRCLPGTVPVDPDQRYNGCERNYTEQLCKVAEETSSYNITDMEKMSWDDNPYFRNSMSEEDCRKSCLQDCNCAGALYESGECKKVKFPVKYARRLERDSSKVFFKVGLKSVRSIATAMKPPVFLFFSSLSQELLRPECGWEAEILAWPMSSL